MHTESEHTFEGGHYDLEMQFVHTAPGPDGTEKVLIIACFYQVCLPVCLSLWEGGWGGGWVYQMVVCACVCVCRCTCQYVGDP